MPQHAALISVRAPKKALVVVFVGDLRVVWDRVQAAAWSKVSFSPWKPGPRGIETCQLLEGRDELALPANYKPKNWWATIPKTGGRPTQELAGTNPKTGRPPYSLTRCSHLRACVHLPRRSRVRVRGHPWGCNVSCAENAFLCGRRSGQPSSSSLAREYWVRQFLRTVSMTGTSRSRETVRHFPETSLSSKPRARWTRHRHDSATFKTSCLGLHGSQGVRTVVCLHPGQTEM